VTRGNWWIQVEMNPDFAKFHHLFFILGPYFSYKGGHIDLGEYSWSSKLIFFVDLEENSFAYNVHFRRSPCRVSKSRCQDGNMAWWMEYFSLNGKEATKWKSGKDILQSGKDILQKEEMEPHLLIHQPKTHA
jgi:hypothetical protein